MWLQSEAPKTSTAVAAQEGALLDFTNFSFNFKAIYLNHQQQGWLSLKFTQLNRDLLQLMCFVRL